MLSALLNALSVLGLVALATPTRALEIAAPAGVSGFGAAFAAAGDVDDDGYGDVLVGGQGWVGLYRGSRLGLAAEPVWTIEGAAFAGAGDVDGDGRSDVIIGEPDFVVDDHAVGRARVFFGGASGIDARAPWEVLGESAGERLGAAVGSAGDVDGDGFADVIFGSPGFDSGRGRARLHLGAVGRPIAGVAWVGIGDRVGAGYGDAVGTAWDVDADGLSDFLVASAGGDGLAATVDLYLGGAPRPGRLAAWSISANGANGAGGATGARGVGDVDGDGFADVAARVDADVVVYFGGYGAPLGARLPIALDSPAGCAPGPVGDANGDGYADLLVGAELVFGGPIGPGMHRRMLADDLGCGNAGVGDVDGDGFADALLAEPERATIVLVRGVWSGLDSDATWFYDDIAHAVSAQDIDGDGFDDLLLGDSNFTSDDLDSRGRAALHRGSARGPEGTPVSVVVGEAVGEQLGWRVAGTGDVDGDGFADVLVTSPQANSAATSGQVQLFWGSRAGLIVDGSRPPALIAAKDDEGRVGEGGTGVGDVDGDGLADVMVGIKIGSGHLDLYRGEPGGLASLRSWRLSGRPGPSERLLDADPLGDVDGDGLADFGITCENRPTAAFFGSSVDVVRLNSVTWGSPLEPNAATAAGDVDGDGVGDVLISHRWADLQAGRVEIAAWRDAATAAQGDTANPGLAVIWQLAGDQPGAKVGDAIAGVGDLDGDGYADIAIGAFARTGAFIENGRAQVYFGGPGGPGGRSWTFDGKRSRAYAGEEVGTVGDLDGDGFPELMIRSRGESRVSVDDDLIRIFRGNGGLGFAAAFPFRMRARRPGSGLAIPAWGSSDSVHGFDISGSARSSLGPARVAVEAEVKPWDVPFDGVVTHRADAGRYDGISDGLPAELVLPVRGLVAGSAFHWRARVRHDPAQAPIQGWSRWLYGGLPGQPASVHLRTSHNHAPVAQSEAFTFSEDGKGWGENAPGLLANDRDSDGDRLVAEVVTGTTHGSLTVLPDGTWFYLADEGFRGVDGFDYRVSDPQGASAIAHARLQVEPGAACLGASLASCARAELRAIIATTSGPRSLRCRVVEGVAGRELDCAIDGNGEAMLGTASCEAP